MPRPTVRRAVGVALSAALLLSACSDDAPEVDDLGASETAEASETTGEAEPTEAPAPEPSETAAPEPTEEPAPEPCPEGQQRVAPGGACFEPLPEEERQPPPPEPEPEPEPEPQPRQTQTQEPEPEPEPEPAPANPCDDRGARTFNLTAVNFSFSTSSIGDVCRGDTVTLTVDEGSHSFTARSAGADTGVFDGGSRSVTIDAGPGTYNYVCALHSQMNGKLTVIG